MWSISNCYKKGIFWCYRKSGWSGETQYCVYNKIIVYCDADGNALEELYYSDKFESRIIRPKAPAYSSKSGENFNHKIEWEKIICCTEEDKHNLKLPFNYYPRGRIEVKRGKVKIFAGSAVVSNDNYREAICQAFFYKCNRKDITWIADDSSHYSYVSEEYCY